MRTFEQRPKATDKTIASEFAKSGRTESGESRHMDSILRLQRTIGNQAVQRLLRSETKGLNNTQVGNIWTERRNMTGMTRGELRSGLPLHTKSPGFLHQGMDARGGNGSAEIEDEHGGTTASPTAGGGASRPAPIAVRNGPAHAPIDSGDRVGMSIAIAITSSSGSDADMAAIQDSEQVGLSYNHTGSMVGVTPLPSSQSGFMPGHPIPDDQHSWSKASVIDRADNHGGSGGFEKKQLDIYTDAAGGVATPRAIPASGYIISRSFTKTGTAITLRTEKRPADVSVNGYSATAGPSPTQGDNVVVRS